jgi:1-acyl-sn-glycerol-3-phosphate acyltransferase
MVASTVVFAPLAVMSAPAPYLWRYRFITLWTTFNVWWLKTSCGVHYTVVGLENLPDTPSVVLSKHQSTWETLALNNIFRPQVWVLKKELLRVPFFGWGLAMLDPIAIDRKAGRDAVEQVLDQGSERLQRGCWVVVFPEGTRTAPGTRRRYKLGGARLAQHTGVPVVPVAHNAGDHWPRRGFLKRPGTIEVVIGPAIESTGRTAAEINALAEAWIETEVDRIRGVPTPALPPASEDEQRPAA